MARTSGPLISHVSFAALRLVAGLIGLLAAFALGDFPPVAFQLFAGHLTPGDRLAFEEIVPSRSEAAVRLLWCSGTLVAASVVGVWAGKRQRKS